MSVIECKGVQSSSQEQRKYDRMVLRYDSVAVGT